MQPSQPWAVADSATARRAHPPSGLLGAKALGCSCQQLGKRHSTTSRRLSQRLRPRRSRSKADRPCCRALQTDARLSRPCRATVQGVSLDGVPHVDALYNYICICIYSRRRRSSAIRQYQAACPGTCSGGGALGRFAFDLGFGLTLTPWRSRQIDVSCSDGRSLAGEVPKPMAYSKAPPL